MGTAHNIVICGLSVTVLALVAYIMTVTNIETVTTDLALRASVLMPSTQSFDMAREQSGGFFDDIVDSEWLALKQKVRDIYPNKHPTDMARNANQWFQNNYEPDFACRHERRIGSHGDGGKWVCDPHRLKRRNDQEEDPPCLVYSVGSNGEASFEKAVKEEIGEHCEIHVFDFIDHSKAVEPTGSIMHVWGIGDESVTNRRTVFKTLPETVKELGHVGRTIDLFKIDCEGCEWSTFASWFDESVNVNLRQVLIELHEERDRNLPEAADDFFKKMYEESYVIFHKEPNIHFWHFGRCVEYAFVKLTDEFFLDEEGRDFRTLV